MRATSLARTLTSVAAAAAVGAVLFHTTISSRLAAAATSAATSTRLAHLSTPSATTRRRLHTAYPAQLDPERDHRDLLTLARADGLSVRTSSTTDRGTVTEHSPTGSWETREVDHTLSVTGTVAHLAQYAAAVSGLPVAHQVLSLHTASDGTHTIIIATHTLPAAPPASRRRTHKDPS